MATHPRHPPPIPPQVPPENPVDALSNNLAGLAVSLGRPFRSAANAPVSFGDPAVAWFVEEGAIDVFLVELSGERVTSGFKHILRAAAGRLVFCFPPGDGPDDQGMVAVGKGLPGCRLRLVRIAELLERGVHAEIADQVDEWVQAVSSALSAGVEVHPGADRRVAPGDDVPADAGAVISARAGPAWVGAEGGVALLGSEEPDPEGPGLLPVAAESWVTVSGGGPVRAVSSLSLCRDGRLEAALRSFHRAAVRFEEMNERLLLADQANRQRAGKAHRERGVIEARRGLFELLTGLPPGSSPLSLALDIVGRAEGIKFRVPERSRDGGVDIPVREAAAASGVRCRDVKLSGSSRWWKGDSGAMLAFVKEDGSPVALLPGARGYRMVDPLTGRATRMHRGNASILSRTAWSFVRPLPRDRAVGASDLAGCAGGRMAVDIVRFLGVGLVCGLFSVLPAVVLAVVADSVLPYGDARGLIRYTAVLAALAVAAGVLTVFQGTALMRIEGRVASRLASAVWDRVLRLKPEFFREYSAGDLSARIGVFDSLRDKFSGTVGGPLLSVLFLAPTFLVIFAFEPLLGWLTLGLGVFALILALAFGFVQFPHQRKLLKASRDLSAEFFQFITGIAKLRSGGAEEAAFTAWARRYRDQQAAALDVARLNGHFVAASAALPGIVTALLFAYSLRPGAGLGVAAFLAAYGVSMTFFAAVSRLGHSFQAVATLAPAVMQVAPLLSEAPPPDPEPSPGAPADAKLGGGVKFEDVSFRYSTDSPLVVQNVSMHADPGQFVAVVGETGCGKSTLLRLALGLHDPTDGAVLYDGRDLKRLDRRSVRRQVGVVMQNGSLRQGTILQNILGVSRRVDIAAAWRAARQAAVAADIEAMPMQMFTPVGENDAAFSGGQAQRIMIASALVREPRILFLDEATSWLDTGSQSAVMTAIRQLTITRFVIAHRLSTIKAADRIYVMHAGRVVQTGGFDELFEQEGRFRELMLRQTL